MKTQSSKVIALFFMTSYTATIAVALICGPAFIYFNFLFLFACLLLVLQMTISLFTRSFPHAALAFPGLAVFAAGLLTSLLFAVLKKLNIATALSEEPPFFALIEFTLQPYFALLWLTVLIYIALSIRSRRSIIVAITIALLFLSASDFIFESRSQYSLNGLRHHMHF